MNYNVKLSARDVQELAGHANLNTTFGYVHPSKERINKHATSLFNTFSRDEIYKNGEDILTIPISHIATIILGNSKLSNTEELKITLEEISSEEISYFNISEVLENCRNKLLLNYPILNRIEKYNYSTLSEQDIIDNLSKEFGKEFKLDKYLIIDKNISI